MPVSPTDFYAYAEATGTPVPKDKKSQAQLAPAVRQWRKAQLRRPQQEDQPDLGDAIAWTGLGAGGLTAIGALALRNPARAAQVSKQISNTQKRIDATRQQVATVLRGKETSATTDLKDIQQTATAAKEDVTQNVETAKKYFEEPTGIFEEQTVVDKPTESTFSPRTYIGDQQLVDETTPEIGAASKPGWTGNIWPSEREPISLELIKKHGGIQAYLEGHGLPQFEIEARIRAYVEKTKNNPELTEEALKILDPDQFNVQILADRNLDRGRVRTVDEAIELAKLEIAETLGIQNARVNNENQFVSGIVANPTGELPRTFKGGYRPTLIADKDGNLYDPVAANLGTIPESVEVVNLKTEISPDVIDPTTGRPVGRELSGPISKTEDAEAFAKKAREQVIVQRQQSEQLVNRVEDFSRSWDQDAREGILKPRTETRKIDSIDLDAPIGTTQDDLGNVISTKTYGEKLLELGEIDLVERVSRGESVLVSNVPFQVNKNRAVINANTLGRDPQGGITNPELHKIAEDYLKTGRALTKKYQTIVEEPLGFKSQFTSVDSFQPGDLLESTKGRSANLSSGQSTGLVAGVIETPRTERAYNLKYQKDEKGYMNPVLSYINPETKELILSTGISDIKNLNLDGTPEALAQITAGQTSSNPNIITTQPIQLSRVLPPTTTKGKSVINKDTGRIVVESPMGQFTRSGQKGLYKEKAYWVTDEIVQAPLQVQKLDVSGNVIEEVEGQLNREELKNALAVSQKRLINENTAGRMLHNQLLEHKRKTGKAMSSADGAKAATEIAKQFEIGTIRPGTFTTGTTAAGERLTQQGMFVPDGARVLKKVLDIHKNPNADMQVGYNELAGELQKTLIKEKQIKLPVLESGAAYEFIESVIGRSSSRESRRRLVTIAKESKNRPLRQFFPITNTTELRQLDLLTDKERLLPDLDTEILVKRRSITADPLLSRRQVGQPVQDIDEISSKIPGQTEYERAGWGDEDWVKTYTDPVGTPYTEVSQNLEGAYGQNIELGRSNRPLGDKRSAEEIAAAINQKRATKGLGPITEQQAQELKEQTMRPVSGPGSQRKPLYTSNLVTSTPYRAVKEGKLIPSETVRSGTRTRRQLLGDNVLGETLSKVRRQLPQFTVPQPGQRFPKGPRSQFAVDNRPKYSGGGPGTYRRIFARDDVQLSPDTQLRPGETQLGFNIQDQIPTKNILSVDRESIIGKAPERISIQRNAPTQGPRAYNPMGQYDSLFAQAQAKSRRRAGKKRGNR